MVNLSSDREPFQEILLISTPPISHLYGLWIDVLVVWFRQFIDLVRIALLNNLIFTSNFERGS